MSDRMLDRLSDGTDFRKNSEIKCQMHSEIERENISQNKCHVECRMKWHNISQLECQIQGHIDGLSKHMSARMSGRPSENVSDRMSQVPSDRISEHMSDRVTF